MADDETTEVAPGPTSFGERLRAAMEEHGPLCVGIDPHPGLFDHWDLPHTAKGLERFTMRCVEAFSGTVAAVKPQSAFYEQFGSAGVAVLEKALGALREAGTLTVLDAKRGDIGSTMAAYATAYLSDHAPLRADAVTLSPYLGYGSLRPAIDTALGTGRGVFVLALTSNPEGATVQHAGGPGASVAGGVVAAVREDNLKAARKGQLGSVGMVVGATTGSAVEHLGLDLASANAPLLAPGIGAQGATGDDLRRVFGAALPHVLAASSREVLAAGPDVAALRDRARTTAEGLRELLAWMPRTLRPALVGVLGVVLATSGCGGYDRDAYCAAVRDVRQPAALGDAGSGDDAVGPTSPAARPAASPANQDDAALRAYLGQVRALEELAPREDEGSWKILREGLESVMTDGAVDVGKVERAQRELTLMAQAAEELDARLLAECGVGLSAG